MNPTPFGTVRSLTWLSLGLLAALLASGCASSDSSGSRVSLLDAFHSPAPPPFLNGPAAVILTNAGNFSAQVSLQSGLPASSGELTSGDLLVRGAHLLYAPTGKQAQEKRLRQAGIRFLWDVAQNRGWILSEALQGCAPLGPSAHLTNVTTSVARPAAEKVEGHPCQQQDVTVTLNDGSTAVFRVWRASDLHGFPLQITSLGSTAPMLLKLSKPRLETPPAELFEPPESFTKYSSPETFLNELVMRQQNLKRKTPRDQTETPLEARPPATRY